MFELWDSDQARADSYGSPAPDLEVHWSIGFAIVMAFFAVLAFAVGASWGLSAFLFGSGLAPVIGLSIYGMGKRTMYVLFVWWGDGSVTQTQFGTLDLAQAGDAQLGGHQKAVDSLIVQVDRPPMIVMNAGEYQPGDVIEVPTIQPMGGRRGRKG